jgi:hypothetical protein
VETIWDLYVLRPIRWRSKVLLPRKLYFSDNIMKVGRILIYEFTNRFTGCVRIIGAEAVISMEW